jgi:hypothetical protein
MIFIDLIRGEELDRLPPMEKMIRQTMYWPDGRRKRCKSAGYFEKDKCHLIQALVDKYNDDHNLLGVCSFSLHTHKYILSISVLLL